MKLVTVQMMKRYRWSLVGPVCTQLMAAMVISTMAMALDSLTKAVGVDALSKDPLAGVSDMLNVLRVDAGLISVLVVGITMNLAASQQMRDLSLLRTIGATPAQMRRCIVWQALLIAAPSSVLGYLLALPVTSVWLSHLRTDGIIPSNVEFVSGGGALILAVAMVLVTSVIGTALAVIRRSRKSPANSVVVSTTGASGVGVVRTLLGATLLIAALIASVVLAAQSASAANAGGLGVVLASSVGVGLLGPAVIQAIGKFSAVIAPGGMSRLAVDEFIVMARPFAGALVPLVIAMSFALINNGMLSTASHETGVPDASEQAMTFAGTLTTTGFAAVAALNCLITAMVARNRYASIVRLVGGAKNSIIHIRSFQAALLGVTALTLSAIVTLITLIPIVHTEYDVWMPWYQPSDLLGWAFAVIGIVVIGIMVPSQLAMRSNVVDSARLEV